MKFFVKQRIKPMKTTKYAYFAFMKNDENSSFFSNLLKLLVISDTSTILYQ